MHILKLLTTIKKAMSTSHIISPIVAFLFTIVLIPIFRKIAFRVQLVDKPNHRKVHQSQIPLVGGICIFMSTSLALLLALPLEINIFAYKSIFIAALMLLIIGVIDDRFDLSAILKLGIQLILAHFIFNQGIYIESLQGLLGIYTLAPWAQHLLTIVVIAGGVNAFNLMDGLDGLAAGIALLGFVVFTIISIFIGQPLMALIFLTLIGALVAFLRFNLSQNGKIFMGDAGSLTLGFIMVVSGVRLLQLASGPYHLSLTTIGVVAVLLVPVLDALRVFTRRAKAGKSPFTPDKTHLHHIILNMGLKHKLATLLIIGMVTCIMLIGYLAYSFLGLTFSIALMLFTFIFVVNLLKFDNKIRCWKKHLHSIELKH
jgi:UDP-GlcNAc:undecaprenyl-phosphate GlcNAc-1-phosphate transferase